MRAQGICSVADCGKASRKRGWCGAHYARWQRTGDPEGSIPRMGLNPPFCSIDGCRRPTFAKAMCNSHYKRAWRHGDPLAGRTANYESRAWLLEHSAFAGSECLTWPFGGADYGVVAREGGGQVAAHREMCTIVHGPPPHDDSMACHTCGRGDKGCVNPGHLYWGDAQTNVDDMLDHGTRLRGEALVGSKLTEGEVLSIRRARGRVRQSVLAERYKITQGAVSMIQTGERWAWLR